VADCWFGIGGSSMEDLKGADRGLASDRTRFHGVKGWEPVRASPTPGGEALFRWGPTETKPRTGAWRKKKCVQIFRSGARKASASNAASDVKRAWSVTDWRTQQRVTANRILVPIASETMARVGGKATCEGAGKFFCDTDPLSLRTLSG